MGILLTLTAWGVETKEIYKASVDLSTEPKVIKFTPTKVGKYPFYCSKRFLFWTHRAKGMKGVLEVEE